MGASSSRARKAFSAVSSSSFNASDRLQCCLPVCVCPNGKCRRRARREERAPTERGLPEELSRNGSSRCRSRLKRNVRRKYVIGKVVGNGAFGQVRECMDRQTGEIFAIKVMTKGGRDRGAWSASEMFRREVMLLSSLSHPNIIRLVDAYEDRHHLYYVMEKCDGGELFEHIVRRKHFDEHDASRLCRQMLLALEYLHGFNIVHRDVKAENFLFHSKSFDASLILIDFGMSVRVRPDETLSEVCGSPHYLAPELLRRQYACPADMWALGVLVFLMLYGRYPYDGHTTSRIVRDILYKPIDFRSHHIRPSSLAICFIRGLLEPDPSKRLTAQEALQHRWILDGDAEARREKEEARIPIEIVRSAHRKVTAGKPVPIVEEEERRSKKESLLLRLQHPLSMATALHNVGNSPLRGARGDRRRIGDSEQAKRSGKAGVNRYWHKGGWQKKPRMPEYSRQHKRFATTPSRMQRFDQDAVADILRDASLRLMANKSSSLGISEDVSRLASVSGSRESASDWVVSRKSLSMRQETPDWERLSEAASATEGTVALQLQEEALPVATQPIQQSSLSP
ncbi:CAM Kinase family, incomplete catalytic triad [Toxoplasma gondii p89]|uniref:non-specific serine/threonine protein kinase n=1 Tax=Toxoplasma gondii p89 TaxID=943119 RepID=A0A086KRF7_TOXGO|nr:CAM Kinase family, incomplete catalytic triad [Toxoplasma gondii p89]